MLKRIEKLRLEISKEDVGPIIRRFLVNTLFDATFVLLGIIVGVTVSPGVSVNLAITTMITSSLALGISAGVSVYEAESLEQERKISKLERALFRDLSGTSIEERAKSIVFVAAMTNFLAPLFSCAVTIFPLLLTTRQLITTEIAGWASVALALSILFGTGVYLGKLGKTNPWKKGLRMILFGLLAFLIGYFLNNIV
jgi:predicted membrane protein (TIGR00267 family)